MEQMADLLINKKNTTVSEVILQKKYQTSFESSCLNVSIWCLILIVSL